MTSVSEQRYSSQLGQEDLLDMFWTMLLARRLDERTWALHRQNKIAFHVSGIGHEALQVAAAFALNRGVDYVYPYYRDLAMCLAIGITPRDFMFSLFGKEGELSSGGRQMPSHWSSKDLNIVTQSSPVATQVPQAAGTAFGIKYRITHGMIDPDDETQPRLALCTLGEGSTSQGEWHEGMNWAAVHQLPFICIVENNNYAISVPFEQQSAVPNVADRAAAYGMKGVIVDGNDVLATYEAVREAVLRAYAGEGPTLIEAKTTRLVPHSSDDDDRTYRTREELTEQKKLDPLPRFQSQLEDAGVLSKEKLDEMEAEARRLINEAQKAAEDAPYPPVESALSGVFAPVEEAS